MLTLPLFLLCYKCHGFRRIELYFLRERTRHCSGHAFVLRDVYLWVNKIVYWNHLGKNHKHRKLQKKINKTKTQPNSKSVIYALKKLVTKCCLQLPQVTCIYLHWRAKILEFKKHMLRKAHNSEKNSDFYLLTLFRRCWLGDWLGAD